ncbi:MAG: hypothetical protein KJO35_11130 [Gammaproteobacteria bacterium]|nr:hypothetical protein [Gammaproteobacteria bacterium]
MDPRKDSHFETIEPLARNTRDAKPRSVRNTGRKSIAWWLAGAVAAMTLAAFLLTLLPDLLQSDKSVTATATDSIEEASERIENQAAQANRKREEIFKKWLELEEMDVSAWAELRASRALELLQAGEQKISALEYREAITLLDESNLLFTALLEQAPGIAADRRVAGWQAFNSANAEKAREHFSIVLAINPDDSEIRDALTRTALLDQLVELTRQARELESDDDLAGAIRITGEALLLDPANETLLQDQERLRAMLAERRFRSAMSQALAALDANDFDATGRALQRAAALRPDAPEVRDARIRLEQTRRNQRIVALQEQAAAAESADDWEAAISHYSEMLQLDTTLVAAQQGRDRARRLASLTSRAEALLAKPEFFKTEVRKNADTLLQQIDTVTTRSPKLQTLATRINEGLRLARVPVTVRLQSDRLTDVQVYRVGRLGVFTTHELELLPGQYTIVGRRDGYRDVRAQLLIEPGQNPDPLVIRCEEQI